MRSPVNPGQNDKAISLIPIEELQANFTKDSQQTEKDLALQLACLADHLESVKYLLSIGANPNTDQNIDEYYPEKHEIRSMSYVINPILIACFFGSAAVLNELLAFGASPEILSLKKEFVVALNFNLHGFLSAPSIQQKLKEKRLHVRNENDQFFVGYDDFSDVLGLYFFNEDSSTFLPSQIDMLYRKREELLESENIVIREFISERTHLIFYCTDAEKVASVIRHDRDASWRRARKFGRPILHDSILSNELFKFPVLLENHVDLEEIDEYGQTPLMVALGEAGRAETVVDELLSRRVSLTLDVKDKEGKNLFDLARGYLTAFIKNLVLSNPGKISPQQLQKKLFDASFYENVELMKFLCAQGASMKVFRQERHVALFMAIHTLGYSLEFEKIKTYIEYLLENGFDEGFLTKEDRDKLSKILLGQNPYQKAESNVSSATTVENPSSSHMFKVNSSVSGTATYSSSPMLISDYSKQGY